MMDVSNSNAALKLNICTLLDIMKQKQIITVYMHLGLVLK
jgi:hypothetical protein